jgi:hypothetical protein
VEKLRSEVFVAIGKDDRRDYYLVADDPADGVSRTIYLGGDRFNDYPVTAVRPIHWANRAAIESCIRTLLSVVELDATGREMLGLAEGIAWGNGTTMIHGALMMWIVSRWVISTSASSICRDSLWIGEALAELLKQLSFHFVESACECSVMSPYRVIRELAGDALCLLLLFFVPWISITETLSYSAALHPIPGCQSSSIKRTSRRRKMPTARWSGESLLVRGAEHASLHTYHCDAHHQSIEVGARVNITTLEIDSSPSYFEVLIKTF